MLKKVLYILASFLVGFLLIMFSISYNTYSVLQDFVNEAIENKEYSEVQRYFSSALDSNKFIKPEDEEDGTHIEIYYALNEAQKKLYNEEGKETGTTFSTLESGIQFTLFNLSDSFKLADEEGKVGGVNIVFENGTEILFPFKTELVNYYDSALNYSFLLLNVSYTEYEAALNKNDNVDETSVITSVQFKDGTGEVKYTFEFGEQKLTFNSKFHNDFEAVLSAYTEVQKNAAEGKQIEAETVNKIKSDYETIFKNNESYLMTHESKKIYGSFEFLFSVISSAVIFLAIDILLAWFIFRKKKPATYVPPYQRTQKPAVKPEPEQFNRNVFDVDAEEVVDVISGGNENTTNE